MNLTRACQFPLLPHRNIAGRSSSHSRHYDPALQEQVKPPGTRLIALRAGAFVVLLIATGYRAQVGLGREGNEGARASFAGISIPLRAGPVIPVCGSMDA